MRNCWSRWNGNEFECRLDSCSKSINNHGAPKTYIFSGFYGNYINNLVFRWPKPLFFTVFGAHGIINLNPPQDVKFVPLWHAKNRPIVAEIWRPNGGSRLIRQIISRPNRQTLHVVFVEEPWTPGNGLNFFLVWWITIYVVFLRFDSGRFESLEIFNGGVNEPV